MESKKFQSENAKFEAKQDTKKREPRFSSLRWCTPENSSANVGCIIITVHLLCRSLLLMRRRARGWALMEWLMRPWSWSVKSCQLTVTKSAKNGWTITTRPHDCRWLLGMVELNNGPINYHLTLEAFAAIHILESLPQLKCEISSLLHRGRCSTSV